MSNSRKGEIEQLHELYWVSLITHPLIKYVMAYSLPDFKMMGL